MIDRPRRGVDPFKAANAVFKPKATEAAAVPAPRPAIPHAKETVSLRIDSDVLAHFQEDGPGWQDRINDALRKSAGL